MLLLVQTRDLVKMRREEIQEIQEKHSRHHSGHQKIPSAGAKRLGCGENQTHSRGCQHNAGAEAQGNIIPLMRQLLDNEANHGSKHCGETEPGRTYPYLFHIPFPILNISSSCKVSVIMPVISFRRHTLPDRATHRAGNTIKRG